MQQAALIAEREKQVAREGSAEETRAEVQLPWHVERLQKQADDLREQRESLLHDVHMLEDALERMKERSEHFNTPQQT